MSFSRFQEEREQAWYHDAHDISLDEYCEQIAEMSDEELRDEHRSLSFALRYPEPGDCLERLPERLSAVEEVLCERGEWL